jgi:N-acetyl-gamma-glutamylphosphate reductase
LVKIFERATDEKCVMWNKIFGFGKYEYEGKSLKGVWMSTGFAVPKIGYTIYTIMGHKNYPSILKRLGKYKDSGKSCLFIKSLADIDRAVLVELIQASLKDLAKKYNVLD